VNHVDLGVRLRREAEVSRRVAHPGIVKVIDEGTLEDGSPYVVMPLMYGESLARLLLRNTELPDAEVAAIASRVAAILHSAHAVGYVHRDVKPEHVLLNRSATGDLTVHLLDFGVCSSAHADEQEKKRESGKVFGTPSYVSPEQASGKVDIDGRADLFSLGIVMFEALSGRVPFSGTTVSKLLIRIIRDDAPRVSAVQEGVDPNLDLLVSRLLAREPKDRLPSARAVSRALAPFVGDRRDVERRIASMLHETSHVADTAPTVRCTVPEQKVA
jgi:serine/threonine-protein kinase